MGSHNTSICTRWTPSRTSRPGRRRRAQSEMSAGANWTLQLTSSIKDFDYEEHVFISTCYWSKDICFKILCRRCPASVLPITVVGGEGGGSVTVTGSLDCHREDKEQRAWGLSVLPGVCEYQSGRHLSRANDSPSYLVLYFEGNTGVILTLCWRKEGF